MPRTRQQQATRVMLIISRTKNDFGYSFNFQRKVLLHKAIDNQQNTSRGFNSIIGAFMEFERLGWFLRDSDFEKELVLEVVSFLYAGLYRSPKFMAMSKFIAIKYMVQSLIDASSKI